jgi:uncharacterized SAM-binding protein YcdF (DUF218 family)
MKEKLINIYKFLSVSQKPRKANFILGLGSFDVRVARQCAKLYLKGFADYIIFSGGFGNGSGNFEIPEAIVYKNFVLANYPEIDDTKILVEPDSTNTGENIEFTLNLVQDLNINLRSLILVTSSVRQERARLTVSKKMPEIVLYNCPPKGNYYIDFKYYEEHGQNLDKLIIDEMIKIHKYPDLGYISQTKIPESIKEIFSMIK